MLTLKAKEKLAMAQAEEQEKDILRLCVVKKTSTSSPPQVEGDTYFLPPATNTQKKKNVAPIPPEALLKAKTQRGIGKIPLHPAGLTPAIKKRRESKKKGIEEAKCSKDCNEDEGKEKRKSTNGKEKRKKRKRSRRMTREKKGK